MTIKLFEPSDYRMIVEWYDAHGLKAPKQDGLPKIGLVVVDTAAGFMYIADGKLALLEGYITNPAQSPEIRDRALDEITKGLMWTAKELKIPRVLCLTKDGNTVVRAEKHGFKRSMKNWTLLTRGLN